MCVNCVLCIICMNCGILYFWNGKLKIISEDLLIYTFLFDIENFLYEDVCIFPPTCLLRISSVKRWTCTVSTSLSRPRRRRGWRESSMHSSTARSPNSGQREQNSGRGRERRGPSSCKKLSSQGNSKSKRNVSHPSTTFFVWRPLPILNWECIGKGRQEKRGLYSSLNYWAIYFIISGSNWGGEEDSRQRERRNASKLWETQGTGEAATGENQKGMYDYCFKYKKMTKIPNTLYVCTWWASSYSRYLSHIIEKISKFLVFFPPG